MRREPTEYDNMTASDLGRETRALGLEKPNVVTLREWADWLAEQKASAAALIVDEDDGDAFTAPEPDALDAELDAMSKDDVIARAEAAGMDTHSRTTKSDAKAWLLAQEG